MQKEKKMHENIVILFQIGYRHYETVGFLKDGELSVGSTEMFRRTAGRNDGPIGDEEYHFIKEILYLLPKLLPANLRPYCLTAGGRDPFYSNYIQQFEWDKFCRLWCPKLAGPNNLWTKNDLVIRRLRL